MADKQLFDERQIDLISKTVATGATKDELELFLYNAKRSGLDPLARQIYFVKRKGKGTIQVGIDGLRLVADRTGQYAGSDDPLFIEGDKLPIKATCVVYKMVQGVRCAFAASARWDEYYPGDDQGFQWRKMPHVMLAKCAEALALRKAFPADLSGLYVHEEMDQAEGYKGEGGDFTAGTTGEVIDMTASLAKGKDSEDGEAGQASRKNDPKTPNPPKADAQALPPADNPREEMGARQPSPANAGTSSSATTPTTQPKASADAPPKGSSAYGYSPERWPLPKMFTDPMTDSQEKMLKAKARERDIPDEHVEPLRLLVLMHYNLDPKLSKGNASVFIDWLINAEDEQIDEAINAIGSEEFSHQD